MNNEWRWEMNRLLSITVMIFITLMASGQTAMEILTEKYVERPVAMHRGQLQFNTGYDFSIINHKYDLAGKRIDLATDGSVSGKHSFPFNLNYGILEFLEVSASISYASMGIRSQNHVTETGVGSISTKEIRTYRGLDDLFVGLALSNPFRLDFLDLAVNGGISLPLFDHKPGQPSHRVTLSEPYPGSMDIEYLYNNKFGLGVPVSSLGGALKFRSRLFSATALFSWSTGLKEGESISWESRLSQGEIRYREIPYRYGVGNTVDYTAVMAWQAISWFAVLVTFEGFSNTGAWSTETGKKVLEGTVALHSVSIGYDIQVTPALRLSQHLHLPYSGKNILAPRVFQTGISLNFMAPAPR
jgi:hypothetical protein